MSQSKWLPTILLSALMTSVVFADANRTFFTQENQFPRWEQLEVGVDFNRTETDNDFIETETSSTSLYLRYGLLDDLAVQANIPFNTYDADGSDSEAGLGDVSVELQLRAYEDIFGYPYFIPYFQIYFPTGSESKNLGSGDVTLQGGLAFGSKINDWISWSFDFGYRSNNDEDNQVIVGHSYVWEISEQFGLLTEVLYEQAVDSSSDDNVLLGGGFTYDWTPDLQMDIFVAGGMEGTTDVEANARVSYSF